MVQQQHHGRAQQLGHGGRLFPAACQALVQGLFARLRTKGSSAAHPDLLAGRTALYIDTISAIQSQVKAGNVRAVAVSTAKRTAALPDVLTADEQGLKGYDANTNGGFLAPAGTPKAIVAKLNAEINAALKLPDVRAKLEAAGIEIQGGTPQDYAALIKSDLVKWGKVVKAAGIQPD